MDCFLAYVITSIDELDQIDNIYLVPNSKNVLISNDKGEIRIVSTTSKKITPLPKKHSGQIKTIDFYEKDIKKMISGALFFANE